jgi:hypothetical protein
MLMCDELALLIIAIPVAVLNFAAGSAVIDVMRVRGSKVYWLEITHFKMRLWDEVRVSLG